MLKDCGLQKADCGSLEKELQEFEQAMVKEAQAGTLFLKNYEAKQKETEELTEWETILKAASDEGVPTKSSLWTRCTRSLTPEQAAEYAALPKAHTAKAAWRKKWAATRFAEVLAKKVKVESWEIQETSHGKNH